MVDFRINWTLQIGEVRKPRLPGGKIRAMTPVGAVSNRTASACPDSRDPDAVPSIPINRNLSGLETLLAIPIYRGVPTKHGARRCLFIFIIHHKFLEKGAKP